MFLVTFRFIVVKWLNILIILKAVSAILQLLNLQM